MCRITLTFLFSITYCYCALGQYERSTKLNFEVNPNAFAYGDLDGSGYEEIIVSFENKDFISIAPNDGGKMLPPQVYKVNSTSLKRHLLISDINNDNLNEIVFTDYDNERIGVLVNKGNFEFEEPLFFATGINPRKIVSSDFNEDGLNDLAIINEGSNTLSILYADPVDLFSTVQEYSTGSTPFDLEMGDLNSDGFMDLVIANKASNTVAIHYGNNAGFDEANDISFSSNPTNLEIKDINLDGILDLAVVFDGQNKINLLYGNSEGTYDPDVELSASEILGEWDFVIDDFNSSGIMDLAITTSTNTRNLIFFFGNGDNTYEQFADQVNGAGSFDFIGLEYTDIAQQGTKGFLSSNRNALKMYENYLNEDFKFWSYREFTVRSDFYRIEFGDINGDNISDFVAANRQFNFVTVYFGLGNDEYAHQTNLLSGSGTNNVALADFNNDGDLDLVSVGWEAKVYFNDGSGSFENIELFQADSGGDDMVIADFNNDDFLDLIVANNLYLNDKDNNFDFQQNFGYNINGMSALDFNNDGNLDLAISYTSESQIKIFPGNGDGTFELNSLIIFSARDIDGYDVNNDGFDDIIANNLVNNEGRIYYGSDLDPFSNDPVTFTVPDRSNGLKIFDVDRNSKPDLVFSGENDVIYYPINDDGTLGEQASIEFNLSYLYEVTSHDYNNDGHKDLIGLDQSNKIEILSDKTLADISFKNLTQMYSGEEVDDVVSIEPDGVNYVIKFNESETKPINTGTYDIVVEIEDEVYKGSGSETLIVEKVDLHIEADNINREYRDENPELSITYTGFVGTDNVDELDESINISTEATATSDVGSYPIAVTGGSDKNYNLTLIDGILEIEKASLSITATDISKLYGSANPELIIAYDGFKGADDESVLDEAVSVDMSTDEFSNVGLYEITVLTGSDDNYQVLLNNGTLSIEKALLTVIAVDVEVINDEEVPALTYEITGYVNGEDQSVIDLLPTLTTNPANIGDVGEYEIIVEGAEDNNYSFEYMNGRLVISLIAAIGNELINVNQVYPIPANEVIHINNADLNVARVAIRSLSGNILIENSETNLSKDIELNIAHLLAGVYLVEIIATDQSTTMVKILKN